jgi:hypothetical protein
MTTTPMDRLRAALADRYRLERELGQGGMATVYLAHEGREGTDERLLMAWLDTRLGDESAAVAELERVLNGRHYVSRAWLRIDDRFAPLRGYPAFDKLVTGT